MDDILSHTNGPMSTTSGTTRYHEWYYEVLTLRGTTSGTTRYYETLRGTTSGTTRYYETLRGTTAANIL